MTARPVSTDPRSPVAAGIPDRWGVVAFTTLIVITPAMPHVNLAHGVLDPGDVTTFAAAVVGLVAVVRSGAWRELRIRRAPEAFALAAMVPFTLIAAIHAGSIRSLGTGPLRWALTAVIVALAYLLIRTKADGRRMIQGLVLLAALEAAFGLIAYAFHWVGPGGYIGVSPSGGVIGHLRIFGRITGTTGMASTFIAGFFALTLPSAAGLALSTRGRVRWAWIAAALLIFAGLGFTLSRIPIGLATIALGILLLTATRPRVWVPVLVVVAAVFLASPLRERMTYFRNDRLSLWRAGWRMFTDNWLFGVGPGRYIQSLPAYQQPGVVSEDITPHNSLLYVASESGVFAALALAVAIALSFRFLRARNPLVLGPMLGLAAFMIDAMTTNLYSIPSIAIAAWMMAPSVAPYFRGEGVQPEKGSPRRLDPGQTDDVGSARLAPSGDSPPGDRSSASGAPVTAPAAGGSANPVGAPVQD